MGVSDDRATVDATFGLGRECPDTVPQRLGGDGVRLVERDGVARRSLSVSDLLRGRPLLIRRSALVPRFLLMYGSRASARVGAGHQFGRLTYSGCRLQLVATIRSEDVISR